MTAPDPTVYDVWAKVMPQQIDPGESPDISIRAVLAAAREIDPGAWAEAVRVWLRDATADAAGRSAPGADEEAYVRAAEASAVLWSLADAKAKLAAIETLCRTGAMLVIPGDPDPVVGAVAAADILAIITGDGETASPQPGTAGFLALNNGNPVYWSRDAVPGGYVCAIPVAGRPRNICGYPVESEPCPEHRDPEWRPE